jgi:hypothetical protein
VISCGARTVDKEKQTLLEFPCTDTAGNSWCCNKMSKCPVVCQLKDSAH